MPILGAMLLAIGVAGMALFVSSLNYGNDLRHAALLWMLLLASVGVSAVGLLIMVELLG